MDQNKTELKRFLNKPIYFMGYYPPMGVMLGIFALVLFFTILPLLAWMNAPVWMLVVGLVLCGFLLGGVLVVE